VGSELLEAAKRLVERDSWRGERWHQR